MSSEESNFMELGVLVNLKDGGIDEGIRGVRELGFSWCQICCWNTSLFTKEIADTVTSACEKYGVKISTFWCGWSGPTNWNFTDGPLTLGLVPPEYRYQRMQDLCRGSDFAKMLGVDKIATHAGFLPENPSTTEYRSVIAALRVVAEHCKANGQYFLFETGQETPVTLLRAITDIGTGNLGINLDPANLILYGKGNPVDALDVFGKYVMDIHGKDGCYPTNGNSLGRETPIGEGKVNFPLLIEKLKEIGYTGTVTIEREISGDKQIKDILSAKMLLEELIG